MIIELNQLFNTPNLNLILNIFIFIFGLCFGSFLNVCIYRIPRKESVVFSPSHCTTCGHQIKFYENVPIFGWLFLRGKCSNCKERISAIYPLVELITGILVLLFWFNAKTNSLVFPQFLRYLTLIFLFIPTFFIDIKHKIIPNKLTYTTILISLLLSLLFPELFNTNSIFHSLLDSFSGAVLPIMILAGFSLLFKLILKKDAIGFGDIKFIAANGAAFGLLSLNWLGVIIVSCIIGGIFGFIYIIVNKKSLLTAIPFGPFLVIGSFIWLFFGNQLKLFYFEMLHKILL